MIKFKLTGIDEMRRKRETLQRRALTLNGPVPLEESFPPEFMRRYTDFKTIEAMLNGFSAPITSAEDFKKVPDAEWDAYVVRTTRFQSWEKMQSQAGEAYAERRLNMENL